MKSVQFLSMSHQLRLIGRWATLMVSFVMAAWILADTRNLQPLSSTVYSPTAHVRSTISRQHARELTSNSTKPIEAIAPGDVVLAVDEATGKRVPRRVVRTFKRVTDHLRLLTVRGSEGPEQRIETTDEHPFWIEGRGWVAAGELRPGDKLTEAGGQPATLVATEYIAHPEGVTVYNFEVEELHSYFVAAQGARAPPLLAHNACDFVPTEVLEQSAKNLSRGASTAHVGLLATGHAPTALVPQFTVHALGQMSTRNITQSMVTTALNHGKKYYDPRNNVINHILEKGFASGKSLIVGQSITSGKITTVIPVSRISKRLIPIQ